MTAARMKEKLDRAARRGAEAALRTLAEAARERTPVDTGRLRESCRVEMDGRGTGGTVRYGAPYAAVRHAAGPAFLADAARSPAVQRHMAEALTRELRTEMR